MTRQCSKPARTAVTIFRTVAFSLRVLFPQQNPLAEGDFYPGDLLTTVLKIPQT